MKILKIAIPAWVFIVLVIAWTQGTLDASHWSAGAKGLLLFATTMCMAIPGAFYIIMNIDKFTEED